MSSQSLFRFIHDSKGVSAVVGVALMVAVTVVLAAMIGGFVFGVGDDLNQPKPETQVTFSYDDSGNYPNVTVYHNGGEILSDENTGSLSITGDHTTNRAGWGEGINGGVIESDASIEIRNIIWQGEFISGETVELQWTSKDGTNSATLGEFEFP